MQVNARLERMQSPKVNFYLVFNVINLISVCPRVCLVQFTVRVNAAKLRKKVLFSYKVFNEKTIGFQTPVYKILETFLNILSDFGGFFFPSFVGTVENLVETSAS